MLVTKWIHVLLSEAGEHEAGPTEFAEHIARSAGEAERLFYGMENSCERFIASQISIICANDAMREYNIETYGEIGAGYFYHLYWLAFPNPRKVLPTPEDFIAHYLCEADIDDPPRENDSNRAERQGYLRRQVGHESDELAIDALVERFCDRS